MKARRPIFIFVVCALAASTSFSVTKTIEISCTKSLFTPNVVQVKKGEPVVLILKSKDVTHGFAIDEYNIAKEVPPGRPVTVEFVADRAGEFAFYCVVRCGKKHLQMRGKLIVE
jgi:heme/copper-type cytochrome/quinol oxidase subunit 2